jgi:putative endopeptidase
LNEGIRVLLSSNPHGRAIHRYSVCNPVVRPQAAKIAATHASGVLPIVTEPVRRLGRHLLSFANALLEFKLVSREKTHHAEKFSMLKTKNCLLIFRKTTFPKRSFQIWIAVLLLIPQASGSYLQEKLDSCQDFYQYACHSWIQANPIPADKARWNRFDEVMNHNHQILRALLETGVLNAHVGTSIEKPIDYYRSCMDEKEIEKQDMVAASSLLERIERIANREDLIGEIARLHTIGIPALFRFGPVEDLRNSTTIVAELDEGGLGLPERSYYTSNVPSSKDLLDAYRQHITRMLVLSGTDPDLAGTEALGVVEIETALATVSMDRAHRRDRTKRDHKLSLSEAKLIASGLDLKTYLRVVQAPAFQSLNVTNPEFFKKAGKLVSSVPLASWRAYLRWHLLQTLAPMLPSRFVKEDYDFEARILRGQREIAPRSVRCVELTEATLGDALGRLYAERSFRPEDKQRVLAMVLSIENAMEKEISELAWMSASTKTPTIKKLKAIKNYIGYPDKWQDYARLRIAPGEFLRNTIQVNKFEFDREIRKIGKPTDASEWEMTAAMVDARYRPAKNDITFTAGILQPPFYDSSAGEATNYGAIGSVIGHELTHGFDDQGRRFDEHGNLRDWWRADDNVRFVEQSACFVKQYGDFYLGSDLKTSGELTLGENIADNGGVRIAYRAFERFLAAKSLSEGEKLQMEQKFFLGWAQIWCENETPESVRVRASTDPHPPGRFRVNGTLSNIPEFQRAFGCRTEARMQRSDRCRVW